MKPLTRAHRRFIRWEPYVGLLIATGFFSFVGKQLKVFGELGWPEAIFLGTGAAAVLSIGLAAGLAGWRYFRPLTDPVQAPENAEASNLQDQFTEAEEQRKKTLTHTLSIQESLSKRLDIIAESVTRSEKRMFGQLDHFKEEISGRLESVRFLKSKITELGELNNQNLDYVRRQIASLYDALAAVYHRERLQELERHIETGAKELSAPTESKACYTAEEWEEWEAKERAWRSVLQEWCDLAACYFQGVDKNVMTVSEEQYKQGGKATADQFPEGGLISYRAFWARLKNWRNWQEDVRRSVHQVAFNGGTAGSRPIFPGAGYLEELGGKSE